MLALTPMDLIKSGDAIKKIRADLVFEPSSPGDKLLPGASALPASIGSKMTIKNALLGALVVATGYLGYVVFFAKPTKKPAATSSGTVSGLFFGRRRRRRRRRR